MSTNYLKSSSVDKAKLEKLINKFKNLHEEVEYKTLYKKNEQFYSAHRNSKIFNEKTYITLHNVSVYHSSRMDYECWNEFLENYYNHTTANSFHHFYAQLKYVLDYQFSNLDQFPKINEILKGLNDAYINYTESEELYINHEQPSMQSIIEFLRYIPSLYAFYNTKEFKISINSENGFIICEINQIRTTKRYLNLTFTDKQSVDYSYINRIKGLVRFSGVADMNISFKNSKEFDKIIALLAY